MTLLVTTPVDWELNAAGDDVLIPLRRVSGAKGFKQRVGILLRMIRGEWFANMGAGMPWFAGNGVDKSVAILGQAFAEVRTRAEVRKIIMSVEGAGKIERLDVTFLRPTRVVDIVWRATTIWGDTAADRLSVPIVPRQP